jgi:hypothetical protein
MSWRGWARFTADSRPMRPSSLCYGTIVSVAITWYIPHLILEDMLAAHWILIA